MLFGLHKLMHRKSRLDQSPAYRDICARIDRARAKHQPVRELEAERTALIHRALRGAR